MARKALGRGLEALLPQRHEDRASSAVREVDIDRVRPNPRQPREHFDGAALEAMATSLQERGMLQPLVVRRAGDGYQLIAGERRWRAAQKAGWAKVPVMVREATQLEALELALVENLQRQDLNPIEEASAYEILTVQAGLTQEQIAARVGRERSTVSNYLRLLKLPGRVQQLLVAGALTMGHARALLGVGNAAAQSRLAAAVVEGGLSVRQTEARVRAERRGGKRAKHKKQKDPDTVAAEGKLTRALGTKVRIQGRERGRIEIGFRSLAELERLYQLLLERTARSTR
ncbi:MAG: ParB/RepB/Spo0J family partition protein [Acidobacteriota bacterium]